MSDNDTENSSEYSYRTTESYESPEESNRTNNSYEYQNLEDLNNLVLNKYFEATKIIKSVISLIEHKLQCEKIIKIYDLCKYSDLLLEENTSKIHKKTINGISFPTSICKNNCLGNFSPDSACTETVDYLNDVIKIKLGVHLDGYSVILAKTWNLPKKIESLIDKIKIKMKNEIKHGNCIQDFSDDITGLTTDFNCFPIKNNTSFQVSKGNIEMDFGNDIILNYKRELDSEGNQLNDENFYSEFENHQVYHFNLDIIPEDETELTFTEIPAHIYKATNNFYNLKLKNSRYLFNQVHTDSGVMAFNMNKYLETRHKMGLKECLNNDVISSFDILYNKQNLPVYSFVFTVLILPKKTIVYEI